MCIQALSYTAGEPVVIFKSIQEVNHTMPSEKVLNEKKQIVAELTETLKMRRRAYCSTTAA